MSRLSRPNLRGRESVFTRGPDIHRGDIHATCPADLAECVMSLEDCCEETHAAQTLLRSGTQDLSRITRVLESQRLFLLVDEGTVKRYKSEISEEIEPAVSELIERAEEGLKALHRKGEPAESEGAYTALSSFTTTDSSLIHVQVDAAKVKPPRPTAGMTMAAQKLEQRRLNMLVKQREQLESQLKALESEVKALEKGDERNR